MSGSDQAEDEPYRRPWYLKIIMAAVAVMIPVGFPLAIGNAGAGNYLLAGGIYLALATLVTVLIVVYVFTTPDMMNAGRSA